MHAGGNQQCRPMTFFTFLKYFYNICCKGESSTCILMQKVAVYIASLLPVPAADNKYICLAMTYLIAK